LIPRSLVASFRQITKESSSTMNTADLSDAYNDILQYVEPNLFKNYGGNKLCRDIYLVLHCFHELSVVLISCVSFSFQVLVVDAGGSLRCGMLGDNLAAMAVKNNWAGVLMYGCIRDSEEIGQMKLGVRALGTMPLKSIKKGQGERDITVRFAGVNFTPGHYVYSDLDGIIVSPKELTLPPPKL
ncbi:unnamed protein product, partial [Porites evermanni]